jgi:Flp pilus assembly protein TadG
MIRAYLTRCDGTVAVMTAAALFMMAAVAALALDGATIFMTQGQLQNAADAAALAAAGSAADQPTAIATAIEIARFNMPEDRNGEVLTASDVLFGAWDPATRTFAADAAAAQAIRVTTRRAKAGNNALKTIFARVFGIASVDLEATAIALLNQPGACLIALDPAAKESFVASGSGEVRVPNCGIYVNSSSATALKQTGSGLIAAKSISVVGGYGAASNLSPTPDTGQPPIADPLADVPEPTVPASCDYDKLQVTTDTILPGGRRYCGDTKISADNVTFGPGIHYFTDGALIVSSNVNVTGDDVLLFFGTKASLQSSGTGLFELSARTSGPHKGIVIFQSRSEKLITWKLTGSTDYFVNGTIYAPQARIEMYGTVDVTVTSKSGYVIAHQFYYQGNSSFVFDAHGGIVPISLIGRRNSLVN